MKKIYFGIFLISVATLALEISLVRIFSIGQYYHFAFMVISIAMFGIAAAGTFLSVKKIKKISNMAILFSIFVLIGFFVTNKIGFDPYKAIFNYFEIFKLFMYYIFLGLPFFFFGIIIAYSFIKYKNIAGKIYFYNLMGSALGSLLPIALISFFRVKIIILISLLGLISALFFIDEKKPLEKLKINKKNIVFGLIVLNLLLFLVPFDINISQYKELNQALNYPNSKLLETRWNSFSRVDVVESSFTRYAPGLASSFRGNLPEQIGVLTDGSNMNSITKYENLDFIDYLPNSIGYYLIENPKVLVINSGVGLDVLSALENNGEVTAIETNPIIISLLKTEYKVFSGDIYNKANVFVGEGRGFLKKNEKYDIIVLSLAGNVLSSTAGITNLNENYLLTKEAFEDYYNNLNENGVIVITRWLLFPPRESLRLMSLALEISDKKNIAIFRSWTTVTLLISRNELSDERINKIKNFLDKNKFDIIYLPANFEPNKYGKFKEPYYYNSVKKIIEDRNEFYKEYLFNVKPVTDNKPFYFNFFKWSKVKELYKSIGQKWQPFFDSGFLLIFIFIQALILSFIFILLPIRFLKKKKINKKPLFYFFCIGLAYLFIEIFFIQKFILFLGHVIYSTSIVIFSVLFFSSLGSLISQKFKLERLKKKIYLLFLVIIFYSFALKFLINYFIVFDLLTKIIVSIVIIAPIAFLMGMPFPLGIRIINKRLIPWAWAVNGSASVLSSIIAVIIALSFGYISVLILAGILYVLGIVSIKKQ